jgi:exopolysaccharide production protein ExoZ
MAKDKQVGIQVARAVAALSIVYFHSWVSITRFPKDTAYQIPGLLYYGWFAVDLFFAISGYVICLVVSRESFNVRSFLIKRVFRLYPLWLVMLTIFAATALAWRGLQPRESVEFFIYSATLLPTIGNPFYNVGWSLQHEIAFYLVVAAIVPLVGLRGLAVFLFASTLASQLVDMPWYLTYLASRQGEFLAGVLAFMLRDKTARFGFWIPCVIGVVAMITFGFVNTVTFPISLFFLITAFANLNPGELAWWRKPATMLGDASYSIYLIHPMVFFTASSLVSKFPHAPLWVQEPFRFSCIGIVIALSLFSWRYFETPIIRFGNRITSNRPNNPDAIRADDNGRFGTERSSGAALRVTRKPAG